MYQRWLTGPSPCRPSRRDADALELHSTRLWAVCSFARGRVAIFCSFCKANPGNQNRPTPAGRPAGARTEPAPTRAGAAFRAACVALRLP